MKNRRNLQRRPASDDSDENLRGKLRELEKQLKAERKYSKHLEKQIKRMEGLSVTDEDNDSLTESKEPKKGFVCKKCQSNNIRLTEIPAPHKKIVWLVCQDCKHRERYNDNK